MTITPIILSGGAGTRLWPLSWGDHPKQFLPLISDKTMIQETLLRLEGLEIGTPIVACGEKHRFLVAQQLAEIGLKPQILLEPMPKNTAPAITAACCAALEQDENAVVIVLPSDHVIRDVEAFQCSVKVASTYAEKGNLVAFGIVPTFPATGYGYVKGGEHIAHHVYGLDKFVEKPCLAKAQEYLKSGEYSWNSGIFVFKAKTFLEEIALYNPEMAALSIKSYEKAVKETDFVRLDKACFELINGDSIDYAVMEKTRKGIIIKLNAGWDDVGSWNALYDISNKDENLNVMTGDVIAVVDTDDSLLIAAKGKIQDVTKIAEKIKERGL